MVREPYLSDGGPDNKGEDDEWLELGNEIQVWHQEGARQVL